MPDAGHSLRRGRIEAPHFAAEYGTPRHDRRQHPRHAHVDAELRGAVHLEAGIEAFRGLAGEAPVFRILERDVGGDGNRGRALGERAVAEPPATGRVDHRAALRPAARRLDAPFLRRRGDQDRARARARFAQRLPRRPHARAAAGALKAEDRIDVRLVGRGELEADLRPVGFELLGQQHRKRGRHTLAHLRAIHDDEHAVVGADAQPRVGGEGHGAASAGNAERNHESNSPRYLQEVPAFHQASFAARWIAARMRW